VALCLAGGSACFTAVLTLLEAEEARVTLAARRSETAATARPPAAPPERRPERQRIAAFAAPALEGAAVVPSPVASAAAAVPQLPTFVGPGLLSAVALAGPTGSPKRVIAARSPIVPPIVRRLPPRDPEDDPAPAALPAKTEAATAVAAARPAKARKPAAAPETVVRQAARPFDATGRSALGGPKPVGTR
jgi:hypothetical protein